MKIRGYLQYRHMEQAKGNDKIFMTSQNRRMHKFSKPLTGFINEKDIKRLDRVYDIVFKYTTLNARPSDVI